MNRRIINNGTISGGNGGVGITNSGTITSLTNSGAISGVSGIINNGSIGTLTNNGTITGNNSWGISNGGTISTLINNGLISGTGAITGSFGGISLLTNNGTISGDISVNQNLTITGGTSSTFGTLSGGTITPSVFTFFSYNLTFASGAYQLLNDDVSVPNGTFSNLGTIQLNAPHNVTGAFAQAATGTLIIGVANPSNYGELIVSGAANMANSNVRITPTSGALFTGETFTVVQALNSGTNYNDINASAAGFYAAASSVISGSYDDLVITLFNKDPFGTAGLAAGGSVAPTMGNVLDQLQDNNNPNFSSLLTSIGTLSGPAQASAIKSLAPSQTTSQVIATNTSANQVADVIDQHQSNLLAESEGGERGLSAGSEYHQDQFWAQLMGGDALRNSEADTDGFRQNFYGITIGMDAPVNDSVILGGAVSWVQSYAYGSDSLSGDKTESDSYQLTGYGTKKFGDYFINALAGIGYNTFNQTRYVDAVDADASSDYNGMQYTGKFEGGRNFAVNNITITPLASLQAVYTQNQGYTESGAGIADLTVGKENFDAYASTVGIRSATSINTSWGKLNPEAKIAWVHDLTDNTVPTSGILGGVNFTVETPRISPNGAQVGLGLTLDKTDNLSLRAEYDGDFRSDYEASTALLKATWIF